MNFSEILEAPDVEMLKQRFPNEAAITDYLQNLRWSSGITSPFDANSKVYNCQNGRFRCKNTRKYFNVKTNTLFHNSKIPLDTWVHAMWLVANQPTLTSVSLGNELGITQKSAWYLLKRIKAFLKEQKARPAVRKVIKAKPANVPTMETAATSKQLPLTEWLNLLKSQQ